MESLLFSEPPAELPAEPPAASMPSRRVLLAKRYAPAAAGALVLLVLTLAAWRAKRRRAAAAVVLAQQALSPAPGVVALPGVSSVPALEGDLRTRALQRAEEDPATAALVVRFWLGTQGADGSVEAAQ